MWSWREFPIRFAIGIDFASRLDARKKAPEGAYTLWSWRESNPRPNKAFKSFLHAQTPKYCREETTVGDPQSLSLVPYLRPVAEPNRQHPDGLMSQSGEIGRPSGGTAYC